MIVGLLSPSCLISIAGHMRDRPLPHQHAPSTGNRCLWATGLFPDKVNALLDHIADYLQFISKAQLFRFTLNTSMTMAATSPVNSVWTRKTTRLCRLSSRRPGVVLSCQLVVACRIASCHPLIVLPSRQLVAPVCCCIASPCPLNALPSHRLVAPAGCRIASRRPLVAPPSRQLVAPACCCITSPRPLVAPRTALSSSCRAGWLLRRFSTRRPLVVLSSCCAASRCLVAPAGCRAIISCRPLVAPPSRPLIVLAGCCVACPCASLSSSCPLVIVHHQRHRTPSNAAAAIEHRRHRRHCH